LAGIPIKIEVMVKAGDRFYILLGHFEGNDVKKCLLEAYICLSNGFLSETLWEDRIYETEHDKNRKETQGYA